MPPPLDCRGRLGNITFAFVSIPNLLALPGQHGRTLSTLKSESPPVDLFGLVFNQFRAALLSPYLSGLGGVYDARTPTCLLFASLQAIDVVGSC